VPNSFWRGGLTVVQRVAVVLMIVTAVNVPLRYLIGAARPEDHVEYSIVLLIIGAVVLFFPRFRAVLCACGTGCC
jgi:hypothetical protein